MAEHTHPSNIILPASPRVPTHPDEINPAWARELTRWLEGFIEQQTGLPFGRFSGLYLPYLSGTGYRLKPGEVFSNGGILTVVREGEAWLGGLDTITMSLGSVTVA